MTTALPGIVRLVRVGIAVLADVVAKTTFGLGQKHLWPQMGKQFDVVIG